MKTHFTKALPRGGRRSLYTAVQPGPNQFFDPTFSPAPRLNPATPSPPAPSAHQPKSQASQQSSKSTYTSLADPVFINHSSPRTASTSTGSISPPFFPAPSPFQPVFYPSILHSSHRPVFELSQSEAFGIPKPGRTPNDDSSTTETLDLSVQVGDDSYFIRPNSLGVADGVGGWARKNGNSALFARRLMHFCSSELSLLHPSSSSPQHAIPLFIPSAVLTPLPQSLVDIDPVAILQRSYERTIAACEVEGVLGASTALLAVLCNARDGLAHQNELRIAHLGDCLIGVIRDEELVFRSSEQQHHFNYPVQLGPRSQSTPTNDAIRIDVPVQEGDVVVLASDGMGDNLWDEDLVDEVRKWVSEDKSLNRGLGRKRNLKGLSEALARRAYTVSRGGPEIGETPFARQAKQHKLKHAGGKPDDISVVVAVIESAPESSAVPSSLPNFMFSSRPSYDS